jgi:peroxiredoxin
MDQFVGKLRTNKWPFILVSIATTITLVFGQTQGKQAPSFYLRDLAGEDFFASRVYGENAKQPSAVVLSFFATWCIPCRAEAPQLEILSNKFPEIQFYLVSVKDKPELILKWLNDVKIELPVLLDSYGRTAKKFNVIGESETGSEVASLPSLFVIDQSGTIVYQHTGYKAGDERILSQFLEALN